jgi:glycosyltransferase involved in cell wall biosynthesis
MINGKKIIVCMPAFNAAKTLEKTVQEIPPGVVDELILVDDYSSDNTLDVAHRLQIRHIIRHDRNKGYGGNQKTGYDKALSLGADVVVMLHPDYQYNPALIPTMAQLVAGDIYDVVLGSRILGSGAVSLGMPVYKYISNRLLTFVQNILLRQKISEYHTGYRAYSRAVLEAINFHANSDNFVFDNQLLAQVIYKGFRIGEISCPASYSDEASSIRFWSALRYGFGVLQTSIVFVLNRWKLIRSDIFD